MGELFGVSSTWSHLKHFKFSLITPELFLFRHAHIFWHFELFYKTSCHTSTNLIQSCQSWLMACLDRYKKWSPNSSFLPINFSIDQWLVLSIKCQDIIKKMPVSVSQSPRMIFSNVKPTIPKYSIFCCIRNPILTLEIEIFGIFVW